MSERVTWQTEDHPLRVSYSEELMDTILQAAIGGLKKIPRRGLEVGGVLWGRRDGDELEIVEWQPIQCEHSRGPGFILSDSDEEALGLQLQDPPTGSDGEHLELIGWYRTRTLGEVVLVRGDADLHDRLFPQSWQIALVIRPYENQPSRGGIFFRSSDGLMLTGNSPIEFTTGRRSRKLPIGFDPANPPFPPGEELAPAPQPPREPRWRRPREVRLPESVQEPIPAPDGQPEVEVEEPPFAGKRRKVLTVAAGVLMLLLAIVIPLVDSEVEHTLSLRVQDVDGQLVVEWNRDSTPAVFAKSGELHVIDGSVQREITLDQEEIRGGSLTYQREGTDVTFDLRLNLAGGEVVSEVANYIGSPLAAPPTEDAPADQADDAVADELVKMRGDIDLEKKRADVLRREIEAEKARLGIAAQ